jgi:hypothetical protein
VLVPLIACANALRQSRAGADGSEIYLPDGRVNPFSSMAVTAPPSPPVLTTGQPAGGATSASLVVPIRPDWDSTLTYDSLGPVTGGSDAASRPVFVGRKDLLDPLVSAIRQPTARGTYLLSGYRGAGKTTLLIEALRQGAEKLPHDWHLLPLILNVSEVSASLGQEPSEEEQRLTIDPRRLLVALLRALRHRTEQLDDSKRKELVDQIGRVYDKAMAAEYSRLVSDRAETARTASREFGIDLKIADLYKPVAAISALGAAALTTHAVLGAAMGGLYAGIVVLAGISAASAYMSRKVTVTSTDGRSEARSLKYDNSLQQLENDLKDILDRLHSTKLRTVVVLEELDKIDDQAGRQLDAVIRYFKNLFTQAPALFFFVTDKAYFDFISSRIKEARRRRSYAVEHTFFTHRVFVGRPTTRDCLDYLRAVVLDPGHEACLRSMYTPEERTTRSLGDLDQFGRLVRVLLFRASNHLFDLKNEMRHFTRTRDADGADALRGSPGAPVELVVDNGSLPEDQAAVAVLQDRVEEKARSFALASGRAYANEVLRDCLYSVFNELGSTRPQSVSDFYPYPPPGPNESPPGPRLLLDEQLEVNEVERIKQAVTSLIGDLHRGGALASGTTDATQQFLWKPNAAGAFRHVRKLERHEEELASEIRQLSAAVAPFKPGGVLESVGPTPAEAEALVTQLDQRATDITNSHEPLTAEVALKEGEDRRAEYARLISAAYVAQMKRLIDLFGVQKPPDSIGPSVRGGGVYLVQTARPDPRFTSTGPRGSATLIVQGDGERLEQDVREFVELARGLERLALIHVIHAPGDQTALSDWGGRWSAAVPRPSVKSFIAKVLPLDEGLVGPAVRESWGRALGREILFGTLWAGDAPRFPVPDASPESFAFRDPPVRVTLLNANAEPTSATAAPPARLGAALQDWVSRAESRLLWLGPSAEWFDQVLDALRRAHFQQFATLELPASALGAPNRTQVVMEQVGTQSGIAATPTPKVAEMVEDLLAGGALIAACRGQFTSVEAQALEQMLGVSGRAIVQAPELGTLLGSLGVTKLELSQS